MDNWVAHRLARAASARFVYEVHDLWPLSPIELSGMSPWHPFALICQSAERYAYRHADAVVSMLPKVHQHMAQRGLDLRKLSIVPNGISPEEWQSPPQALRPDVEQALDEVRRVGGTVVGYAGSMGLPNALDVLLDAAKLLKDQAGRDTQKPLQIILVGDGHERPRLVSRMASEGLTNVTWLPPIPKAQIPAFLSAIDVAYIGWQRVPIYRFGIAPNKLMDYMMASRTVLHSVEAGNDPDAVARGLMQLARLSPKERRVLGDKGRAWVLAHHSYPVLARRFLDAVRAA
jgi:glycosyltransferase involved in cell wall biosynthesis